jgi:hypothetical protein
MSDTSLHSPQHRMRKLDSNGTAYEVNHITTVDGNQNFTDFRPGFPVLNHEGHWLVIQVILPNEEEHTLFINWAHIIAIEIIEL